ncbi:MAG TPA: hypothetical protein VGX28_09695 [Frankiaceae bacterium]|nr:hypothetical protein [Frankiaceae bacterium]
MKRLLTAAAVAVLLGSAFGATPASARCSGTVSVACDESGCIGSGEACTPVICAVWLQGRCVV